MLMEQSQIVNIIVSTLGVIFIAFVSILIIKKLKFGNLSKNNPIKILVQYPVTNKDKLILVEVRNKELLLGLSSNGFRALGEVRKIENEEIDALSSLVKKQNNSFITTLNKTMKTEKNIQDDK